MLVLVRDAEGSEVDEHPAVVGAPRLSIAPEGELVVEARRLDNTLLARRAPWVRLLVNHLAAGGLSGTSEQPIAWGERVSVYVPQRDGRRGFTAYGRVMECEAEERGYRVAVGFEAFPAA
jgi:hypothetical protein